MKFGITLRPDERLPASRAVDLAKRAEANGFEYGWMFDSHVLWQEPYPLLTLMGAATTTLRLGTCVTNPATRDITVTASALATLNELTGGRMDLGIGRGDSARRGVGKKPTTGGYLEECCRIVRALTAGGNVVGEPRAGPGVGGRLRTDGPRGRRPRRRRDHPPARRPRHHPMVHGLRPR